jgi:uncharacterized protein YciI
MSYFAVIRGAGPGWTAGTAAYDQPGVDDHSTFMNELARRDVVLLAGPLAGTDGSPLRALVIMDAEDEADVHAQLADDPWATTHRLQIISIEPWHPLLGAERLRPAQPARRP